MASDHGSLQAARAAIWQQAPRLPLARDPDSRRALLIPTSPCVLQGEDTGEQHRDRRRRVERALALQALTSSVRVLRNLHVYIYISTRIYTSTRRSRRQPVSSAGCQQALTLYVSAGFLSKHVQPRTGLRCTSSYFVPSCVCSAARQQFVAVLCWP
jgi:hypothetical protein